MKVTVKITKSFSTAAKPLLNNTIYNKADVENISHKELKELIENLKVK